MRVAVPFGKTKIYTGIVSKIHTSATIAYEAKDIHQILDEGPIVNEIQLQLLSTMDFHLSGRVLRALSTGTKVLINKIKNGIWCSDHVQS